MDINPNETSHELYVKLKYHFNKWVKPEAPPVKIISHLSVLIQFRRMMNPVEHQRADSVSGLQLSTPSSHSIS